jgi:acyl carrier protein
MTRDDIQAKVMEALVAVAPEAGAGGVNPDVPLRDQVDLDSMDFLRFVVGLHEQLGVDVPESDYGKIASVAAAVDYFAASLGIGVR